MKKTWKKLLSLALACTMAISLLSGCSGSGSNPSSGSSSGSADSGVSSSGETGRREVVSIGATSEPNTYFPYAATSTSADYVYDFIYDRLVYTDYEGNFTPRLAESWESNNDGTVITFHLNPNVKKSEAKRS